MWRSDEDFGLEHYEKHKHCGLTLKGALQLLINRYGQIRFAQIPERVSTKCFVVLIIANSKSNQLDVQGA